MRVIENFLRKHGWVPAGAVVAAREAGMRAALEKNAVTVARSKIAGESIEAFKSLERAVHKERTRWLAGDVSDWHRADCEVILLTKQLLDSMDRGLPNVNELVSTLKAAIAKRDAVDDFEVKLVGWTSTP